MQSTNLEMASQQTVNLDEPQLQRLSLAVQGFTNQQLHWASGYLAGLSQVHTITPINESSARITILYASHTGNGRSIAERFSQLANSQGINSNVFSVADFKPRDLLKEQVLFLIISTHGEGDIPEASVEFHRYLFSKRAPKLDNLSFSVFALGDSSYENFCQAGKDFDQKLEELGAKRLMSRVDADVNFNADAEQWSLNAIEKSNQFISPFKNNVINLAANTAAIRFDRNNPFQATLLESRRISTDDAIADVYHIELQIDARTIQYKPGDALGVWARNKSNLVTQIIKKLELDAEQTLSIDKQNYTLQQALEQKKELTQLHPSVIKEWSELTDFTVLKELIADKKKLNDYAGKHQFIDLIEQFPAKIQTTDLVQLLQPLQPRLYSISSSQQRNDDEVHLTVSALRFHNGEQKREGTTSCFLAERIEEDGLVSVYVVENTQFRLPENKDTPIIMVGAGTGIAPYRAFLQQRQEEKASGKNWLILGNRNFHKDFLYQLDWQHFHQSGLLNKISLAFSRDTVRQAYIQDKILEQGEEIYRWLEQGAHFYVCGATAVEQAVRETIIELVAHYGELDQQGAEQYIDNLRSKGRYLRDVY